MARRRERNIHISTLKTISQQFRSFYMLALSSWDRLTYYSMGMEFQAGIA